jgi:hypothetical protein
MQQVKPEYTASPCCHEFRFAVRYHTTGVDWAMNLP